MALSFDCKLHTDNEVVHKILCYMSTWMFFFFIILEDYSVLKFHGMYMCMYMLYNVGGESGSADTVRDPRGFAVKFYTEDGNWDLVGNNTPIFFIRDPILVSWVHAPVYIV